MRHRGKAATMSETTSSSASGSPAASPPSIALPVAALVSLCVCWPLGIVLSIVAIVKYGKAVGTTAKTLAIVALALNLLALPFFVGIVAAIAIPNFVKFQCRSKQSEAKSNLQRLYIQEESFHAEADRYSARLDEIGFTPAGTKVRYEYRILSANNESFTAEATGTGDMAGDRWVIDENRNVQNTESACR
jgi:type IV pilus assembly protein PilA